MGVLWLSRICNMFRVGIGNLLKYIIPNIGQLLATNNNAVEAHFQSEVNTRRLFFPTSSTNAPSCQNLLLAKLCE